MNENDKKKRGLGALDVVIIVLLLAVAGSAGFRYYRNSRVKASEAAELSNYVVNFQIKNIRGTSADNYLKEGEVFYLDENNELFGTYLTKTSYSDAQKYYEMPDGTVASVTTSLEGEQRRVDVEVSILAYGRTDENGCFLLNGKRYIVNNSELQIHSRYVSYTVLITGVSESQ